MPTLAQLDILLLERIFRNAFINWIKEQQLDEPQRRQLIKKWRQLTGATWSDLDYETAQVNKDA